MTLHPIHKGSAPDCMSACPLRRDTTYMSMLKLSGSELRCITRLYLKLGEPIDI